MHLSILLLKQWFSSSDYPPSIYVSFLFQVSADQTDFTVKGLIPKKKYKIRVKAKNKEGESAPLETEKPIEAKNPYGGYLRAFPRSSIIKTE